MITETGTLPIGVEYEGKVHREFEVRPRLVRDSIEISAEQSELGSKNSAHLGACILAKQIIRIGDIPKEAITAELVLDMYEDDGVAVQEAKDRVEARLKSFRGAEAGSATDAPSAAETGV
jgi:hypothetical protein